MKIKLFGAEKGDAILIKFNDKNILIDGGVKKTYSDIKKEVASITKLDAVFLSHYDEDHIGGLIELLVDEEENSKIEKVYGIFEKDLDIKSAYEVVINKGKSLDRSGVQLCSFESLIKDSQRNDIEILESKIKISEDIEIEVLSPLIKEKKILAEELVKELSKKNKLDLLNRVGKERDYQEKVEVLLKNEFIEDKKQVNLLSLILLIKIKDKKYLFTGDTSTLKLENILIEHGYNKDNKLKLELFKIPHHGSKKNFKESILDLIDCENFLLLTDSKNHGHPSKEMIVRLLSKNFSKGFLTRIYSNYDSLKDILEIDKKLLGNELLKYNYEYYKEVRDINLTNEGMISNG